MFGTYVQNELQNAFTMEANTMNPDQTVPKEAVWTGAYSLQ